MEIRSKNLLLLYWQNNQITSADGNTKTICTCSTFVGQLASSFRFSFKIVRYLSCISPDSVFRIVSLLLQYPYGPQLIAFFVSCPCYHNILMAHDWQCSVSLLSQYPYGTRLTMSCVLAVTLSLVSQYLYGPRLRVSFVSCPCYQSMLLLLMMMMSWCLMSSYVIWHIRDKLWPMPKHGSIKSTYIRCMRV